MSTELSNGVIIPEEYSDDWYDEMSINLRKLNDVITAASDNATDIQRLDTDKANQSDLTALTSRVSQNETDIIALQTAVSGALKREIVQTLPTEDISTTTIYMIRNSQSSGTNIYDEYMYINSQWELIGTSATDFNNYYTKNETDNLLSEKVDNSTLGSYYTKTESDNLLSAKANQTDLTALGGRVTQTETDITALQTAVSGALKREIVQTLPTQDISTTTIYMIRNTTTSGDNIYDEYMYINNLWELIGTSATDFSNYYTKTEIDTLLSGKQASLSQTQLDAVNSGIDSSKVQQIATNTSDISSLQSGKADDNSVVHTSGNETVGGQKTLVNLLPLKGEYLGTEASNNGRSLLYFLANRDTQDQSGIFLTKFRQNKAQGSMSGNDVAYLSFDCLENSVRTNNGLRINFLNFVNDIPQRFMLWSGITERLLGVPSSPWSDVSTDKINSLNPGVLSFPDLSAGVDISGYITLGSSDNTYTPPVDGWISIYGYGNACALRQNNLYATGQYISEIVGSTNRLTGCCLCVKGGVAVDILLRTVTSLSAAYFYPCQGNI